jgi:hypothetical protein
MLERDSRPRNMPKTVNNRCQTLRHLFHVLDGKRQPTSADEVDVLPIPPTVKRLVSPEIFKRVAENLKEGDAKTRARFMVIGATGCHPASLKSVDRTVLAVLRIRYPGGSPG